MADTKTGGSAFPAQLFDKDGNPVNVGSTGMTLRDWFAGQALSDLACEHERNPEAVASVAYQYADAMLKARKEQ